MDFVAIDFETANEKRNSACSVGIAVVSSGCLKEVWHSLIRPIELRVSYWNQRIHGISEEQLRAAPTLQEIWPKLQLFLNEKLVVTHNASFDISVLRHSLNANKIRTPKLQYLCSLEVSRSSWPGLASYSLGFLSAQKGIELDHHNAQQDAVACAKLTLLSAEESQQTCPYELAGLHQISIGHVFSNEEWIPCRGIGIRAGRQFELELPDGFDISKHVFFGKRVVFTGTLTLCSRDEANKVVMALGGTPCSTVSTKVDYIITGYQDLRQMARNQSESAKLRKAKELKDQGCKIQILTDQDFQQMLFSSIPTNQEET